MVAHAEREDATAHVAGQRVAAVAQIPVPRTQRLGLVGAAERIDGGAGLFVGAGTRVLRPTSFDPRRSA